jgi:hypothetical protein
VHSRAQFYLLCAVLEVDCAQEGSVLLESGGVSWPQSKVCVSGR